MLWAVGTAITGVLAFEVPFFGTLLLGLLALVPAAVITLAKGRTLLFLCGWLTLGIPWIVGAIALAPPESSWAQRFYGEERLRGRLTRSASSAPGAS